MRNDHDSLHHSILLKWTSVGPILSNLKVFIWLVMQTAATWVMIHLIQHDGHNKKCCTVTVLISYSNSHLWCNSIIYLYILFSELRKTLVYIIIIACLSSKFLSLWVNPKKCGLSIYYNKTPDSLKNPLGTLECSFKKCAFKITFTITIYSQLLLN